MRTLFPFREIPIGAFFFVSEQHLAAKLIRFYENVESGNWFKNLAFLPHHVQGIYTGEGKHLCWSAEATGFRKVALEKRLTKGSTVVMAVYKPMTVEQVEKIKAYCYGARGKAYDFGGIANFGFRTLGWIPGIGSLFKNRVSQWDWALFCSESVVEEGQVAGLLVSDKRASETTPAHVLRYIGEGLYDGQDRIQIGDWEFRKFFEG